MEVRFRPLSQSLLARRTAPGQAIPESGLNFLEIVESVTGAENNPEESPNSNSGNRQPLRKAISNTARITGEEPSLIEAEKPGSPSTQKKAEGKPVGQQIDMTG
ncbi:MAG: hypothetical protein C4532_19850 [Candidatus Abyssobacteria bacterium SURF_17]|jgi:hypothetical protein|uniref:Uncharacterized protein n=1 Tax=Candidatus Abyssobacteria bacterium SURF_17 TaxID=2093361 RepID=A0A419EN27_9BACT|nr:MAG: hypothetical protein C4532_19850 [Candidatus Abyssubacteria bacterium SURF_17]